MSEKVMMKLSKWQRFILKVRKRVFIGMEKHAGWKSYLPIYAFPCDKHGIVTNHPHGYEGILPCPQCCEEEFKRVLTPYFPNIQSIEEIIP
jgi:hypothetical protein